MPPVPQTHSFRTTACLASLCAVLLLAGCDPANPESETKTEEGPERSHTTKNPRMPTNPEPPQTRALRDAYQTAIASESGEERHKRVAEVAWNAIELDPELASEALSSLPPDHEERILLLQHLALRKAEDDPEQALAWAASLATESESAAAYAQIALVLAESDPERAANLLSETGIQGHEFDVAVVQVLQRWADQSPPAAAAWVAVFPPGDFRSAGIHEVLSRWLPSDPESAFHWISSQNDESIVQDSRQSIARTIHEEEDPLRARLLNMADPPTLEILREIERQDADHAADPELLEE